MSQKYDAVIIGGGAVGATLALALGQLQRYQILLVEKKPFQPAVKGIDKQTIALSYASQQIFQLLGVWDALADNAIPIQQVLATVKGQWGSCRLRAQDQNVSALGYVVGIDELEAVLYEQLNHLPQVDVIRPGVVLDSHSTPEQWELEIQWGESRRTIQTRLLVGADGTESMLRKKQHIPLQQTEYDHYAIIANVVIETKAPFTAVERFLSKGALALLPWQNNQFTCVWTMSEVQSKERMQVTEEVFLQACQSELGQRFGILTAMGKRRCFPLQMQIATLQHGPRFLLMGNAAHFLHPIAAQGFNLSLRDIWQLYNQARAEQVRCDLGNETLLSDYIKARTFDQNKIIFATDKIARFMSGGPLPLSLRAMGMTLFDSLIPLKKQFTRYSMGL